MAHVVIWSLCIVFSTFQHHFWNKTRLGVSSRWKGRLWSRRTAAATMVTRFFVQSKMIFMDFYGLKSCFETTWAKLLETPGAFPKLVGFTFPGLPEKCVSGWVTFLWSDKGVGCWVAQVAPVAQAWLPIWRSRRATNCWRRVWLIKVHQNSKKAWRF